MKNIFMVLAAALMCSVNTFAQTIPTNQVPTAVLTAFKAKFAAAEKAKWEKENSTEYEATFTFNQNETSAKFDNTGKWLETETEITTAALPGNVTQTLAVQYAGYKVNEAEKADTYNKGQLYEIELSKNGDKLEVQLTADGKVVNAKKHTKD